MQSIKRSALVPYSAAQMFAIVDDIEAYPEFLPWCKSTNILEREQSQVRASIELCKAGIHKTFTTLNRHLPGECIEMNLVDGPFKHLHGQWQFQAMNETACKILFDIEFEFSSGLLNKTLGPVFGQICNSLVEAFIQRARSLYQHG
ncbi:MAG: type II toxin-antitoxin system RatA family toxin [Gammaproteobacteria bacterium]|nr:type II toxin-antitoxin system RatA family toxin [Gammaproteobacteria bacterium]MDH5729342.1 type II toxin-antitoxin system RatA family toxin [Gammaproteobacteria bacterium]